MESGRFVVMVGPDGVGKTSLAATLLDRAAGAGRYFHFRPEGPPTPTIPSESNSPKFRGEVSTLGGWIRILLSAWRFQRGYKRFIAPAVAAGSLVIGDRWAYGYVVQPRSLKFNGPDWLARFVVARLPQPDLVVNLVADTATIRTRKTELSDEEIAAELEAWAKIPARHVLHVDSTESLETIAQRVEEALE